LGVFRFVLDLLFPPRCAFCRDFLRKGQALCAACEKTLPFCTEEEAVQPGEFYSHCVSPLFYEDTVRESHHRYKFNGFSFYSRRAYAPLLAACITAHYAGRYDLITWVPLSRKRRKKRGYDQAKLLAVDTAALLQTRAVAALHKHKDTAAQSGLGGRDQRQANIFGAYEVPDPALIADKRVLLIDDVVTTGASLSECARCLLMAGAEEVFCATLARSTV